MKAKELMPLIVLYLLFNLFFLLGKDFLAKYTLDHTVLIIANSIFFIVSVLIFRMQKKAAAHPNPNVFVRSVMGGLLIKMVICITAIAVYAFGFKSIFNKMSVFAAMILYIIYLVTEVRLAMKMNSKKDG